MATSGASPPRSLSPTSISALHPMARLRTVGGSPHSWSPNRESLQHGHHRDKELKSGTEELEEFASSAENTSRSPPLLPNVPKQLDACLADEMMLVDSRGEILAVPSGSTVHVWSSVQDEGRIFRDTPGGSVTALALSSSGRYVWGGTSKGYLFEVDLTTLTMTSLRRDAHRSKVTMITRGHDNTILSLSQDGRLVSWLPDPAEGSLTSLRGPAVAERIAPKPIWTQLLDGTQMLFAFYLQHKEEVETLCEMHVYEHGKLKFDVGWKIHRLNEEALGSVSSVAVVPAHPNLIFLGHLSGHVSAWDRDTFTLVYSKKLARKGDGVTCLVGPSRYLWVGFESGFIDVIDIADEWKLLLRWKAHKVAVLRLFLDTRSLWLGRSVRIVSSGKDQQICFWDGLLATDWIQRVLAEREHLFATYSPLKVSIFTYNLGAAGPKKLLKSTSSSARSLLRDFLTALPDVDVVVFGLQEVIDLSDVSLAAQSLLFASQSHDVTPKYSHWRLALSAAVKEVLGTAYTFVKDAKLVGLYSCIFAKTSVSRRIKDLDFTTVKTGFDSEYGNKGAILLRFTLDDSSLCFLNNHLAAGEEEAEKRRKDVVAILDGATFKVGSIAARRAYSARGDGSHVSDHSHVFFAGDLNFRVTLPRRAVLQAVKENKAASLLPYDELGMEMSYNPSFRLHSYTEQPITFPPTYKYDTGSPVYDTSPKKRVPSWCDRILYRSESELGIKPLGYRRFEAMISDHRPVAAFFEVKVRKINLVDREREYREVLRDWATEEQRLLEDCRDRYEAEDDY